MFILASDVPGNDLTLTFDYALHIQASKSANLIRQGRDRTAMKKSIHRSGIARTVWTPTKPDNLHLGDS